ncbi:hypothetical protein [Cupriavidus sp. UYPR2.512]|uniref:hypothetical protein n=1 Tax=Cupriavidus sp. UYPR2.512 TaxID=1080187 RepID=UPI0012F953D5|nr:hypothetical protein [Cupriavidus sp. UYPR2.512]UIF89200.1 hypothetical protein KAF44_29920 [Cupriavidus necator]
MKKAMLTVRRAVPDAGRDRRVQEASGRRGKVLVSQSIEDTFTNAMLIAAARRLVPQAIGNEVTLPVGVDL